jgi:hypothetical protein
MESVPPVMPLSLLKVLHVKPTSPPDVSLGPIRTLVLLVRPMLFLTMVHAPLLLFLDVPLLRDQWELRLVSLVILISSLIITLALPQEPPFLNVFYIQLMECAEPVRLVSLFRPMDQPVMLWIPVSLVRTVVTPRPMLLLFVRFVEKGI